MHKVTVCPDCWIGLPINESKSKRKLCKPCKSKRVLRHTKKRARARFEEVSGMEEGNRCGSHLYVMSYANALPGLFKIGRAKNPAARAINLESGHAVRIRIDATFACVGHLETTIHKELQGCRRAGEWFEIDLDTIKRVVARAKDRNIGP